MYDMGIKPIIFIESCHTDYYLIPVDGGIEGL